jgi:hypothetical protein
VNHVDIATALAKLDDNHPLGLIGVEDRHAQIGVPSSVRSCMRVQGASKGRSLSGKTDCILVPKTFMARPGPASENPSGGA